MSLEKFIPVPRVTWHDSQVDRHGGRLLKDYRKRHATARGRSVDPFGAVILVSSLLAAVGRPLRSVGIASTVTLSAARVILPRVLSFGAFNLEFTRQLRFPVSNG